MCMDTSYQYKLGYLLINNNNNKKSQLNEYYTNLCYKYLLGTIITTSTEVSTVPSSSISIHKYNSYNYLYNINQSILSSKLIPTGQSLLSTRNEVK